MAKPKPPVSAWIVTNRKLRGWKPADLARELRARGVRAEEGTVRTWEAGRKPSDEAIAEMERLVGVPAPRDDAPADMAGLIAALNRVAALLEAQANRDTTAVVEAAVQATVQVLTEQGRLATPREPAAPSGGRR